MSGFHEVSFPLPTALGATGGPERRTDVVTLGSGREVRNTPWAASRRRYDAGGLVRTLDDLHTLLSFFEARRGRLYGFRFRDPFDWRSGPPQRAPGPLDQTIGVGAEDARSFQLKKLYGAPEDGYQRVIRKPRAGSVRVAVAGAELTAGQFSVDTSTGVVTLSAAPTPGAVVTAGFEFDTPVRFDADRLELALDAFGAGRAGAVTLIELVL